MSEFSDADLRIADSEREAALTALGEHMSAGRLDIDEYGERSAQVATAKTRGQLRTVFADLPAPHPRFDGAAASTPPPAAPVPSAGQQVATNSDRRPVRAVVAGLVPVAVLAAVGLFLVTHFWVFFLIPAAVILFGKAVWGDNWRGNHHDHRRDRDDDDRHDPRQARRDFQRGFREDYRQARRDYRRDRRRY